MNCLAPSPKPLEETLYMSPESCLAIKKMVIFYAKKIPHTKWQFSCNHPIQTSFKAVFIAVMLTSGFMYTYIMLILVNRWLLKLICSLTKALNG